jgi:hypothetical protein
MIFSLFEGFMAPSRAQGFSLKSLLWLKLRAAYRPMSQSKGEAKVDLYNNAYGKLEELMLKRVREETYGEGTLARAAG